MGSLVIFHRRDYFVYGVVQKIKCRISAEELAYRQSLPLEIKEMMSMQRLREFINHYEDKCYLSFSGGKDSTVVYHLLQRIGALPGRIPVVYLDTWLEYPSVREFVRSFDNVEILKPKKSMRQIIADNGWCFPSKDVADLVEAYRRGVPYAVRRLQGLNSDGSVNAFRKERYTKWIKLAEDAPFRVSGGCCRDQKEHVITEYEKRTGRHPILALMASESERRKTAYLRTGCNAFDDAVRPMSKPIGFWTEQDVLHYIDKYDLHIAPPYGCVVRKGEAIGQLNFDSLLGISNCSRCLKTTGESRTGCVFCPVACHLDRFDKFKRLKETYPKLYEYVMDGLGFSRVASWITANYVT